MRHSIKEGTIYETDHHVYLAGSWFDKDLIAAEASKFRAAGFIVTSSWHDNDIPVLKGYNTSNNALRDEAIKDLQDILEKSNTLVYYNDLGSEGGSKGGRDVEFGVALVASKAIVIVGPRRNAFHHLNVPAVESTEQAIEVIQKQVIPTTTYTNGRACLGAQIRPATTETDQAEVEDRGGESEIQLDSSAEGQTDETLRDDGSSDRSGA